MSKLPKGRLLAYAFLLINTCLWGFASPIIKYSLNFTSPSTFLLYRYLFATIIFLPFFVVYLQHRRFHFHFGQILLLAILGTPLTLLPLFYGLNLTTSIEASILVSTSPMFTILGGLFFLREKIDKKEWLGFLMAMFGTLLLTLDPIISGHGRLASFSLTGNILIVISNLFWTAFLLYSKKFKFDPLVVSFFSFLVSIPFMFIFSISTGTSVNLNSLALPGILYMAIFGSVIAFWAYQEGQKRIEASEAAMFTYLQPLFALPLSLVWLHEPMSPISIVSLVFILLGVFVV